MEKGDFLEIIAKKFNETIEFGNGNLTIGFKRLELTDQLPSIFKCRIQLFEQWFGQWSDDEKDQLLNRIKNLGIFLNILFKIDQINNLKFCLDDDFSEKLNKTIETGKLPANNLFAPSYEISDEIYEELRKNHSLNSISSIDLLNTSNCSSANCDEQNGLINGNANLINGNQKEISELFYQNGHSTDYQNGNSIDNETDHHNEQDELDNDEFNNEDSINNQISSLETDNAHNGDTFNESESNNENL